MNFEITSPKYQDPFSEVSEDSPDTYFPSTDTLNQNQSPPADFVILCPSPELNIFDNNQAIYGQSIYKPNSINMNVSQNYDDNRNELASLHSFELLRNDNKLYRQKSVPKEMIETENDIDVKSNISENNLRFKLKDIMVDDMESKAAALDKEISEKLHMTSDSKRVSNPLSPSINNIDKDNSITCNCRKSKCLRLHCVCFARLKECDDSCKCNGCKNNTEFKSVRNFVIEKTREINPLAFKPKIKNYKGININSRGCNCAKNNCLKRYCECFKTGSGCTKLCTCVDCKNSNEYVSKDDITNIKDKGYRRKHKIVINEPILDKRGTLKGNPEVHFVKHKKKKRSRLNITSF